MKKKWIWAMACLLLVLAAPVRAAEQGASGFYHIGSAQGVEIEPLLPDGRSAPGEICDADGDGAAGDFYPGSAALRVTLTDTELGGQYLLLVREAEGETVYFADQLQGGGQVAFSVRFALPDRQTDLLLCIGSDAADFVPVTIPLSYTPAAAGEEPAEETLPPAPEEEAPPAQPEQEPLPAAPPEEEPDLPVPPEEDPAASSEEGKQPGAWLTCSRDERCVMAAFTDLDRNAWYHDGIHYVLEQGIMNGYDGGLFLPGNPSSRAMLVTMLWRLEGRPVLEASLTFADVDPSSWYGPAVRWAAAMGIVGGYDAATFAPNDPVTREQLAVILYRYIRGMGGGFPEGQALRLDYADAGEAADWAVEALCWMTEKGIIQGTGENRLSPKGTAARAQIAVMLMRYAGI